MSIVERLAERRPVEGWPYEVGADGRLWRTTGGQNATYAGRELMGSQDARGYVVISLHNQGVRKMAKLHRLVATAFIPNHHGLPDINHKNGIKTDNRADNLEWVTSGENTRQAYALGLKPLGERVHTAKLTEASVLALRNEFAAGGSTMRALGRKYGIHHTSVSALLSRRTWKHLRREASEP